MAVTQNTYTGNGSTTLYSFTFPYLEEDEIKVSLNGTLTTAYTLANATTISFNTAPSNGVAIRIYRSTDITETKSTFFPGSAVRAQDLNENFLQTLYVAQETQNEAASATSTSNTALSNSAAAVSTANTANTNASAAVSTANTAASNASAAVSTANTASTNASNAVTTANSAVTTANAATATANTASTNASAALAAANAAVTAANTATTNASNAVSTANTANTTANNAVTTANNAVTTANSAVTTANSALTSANNAVSNSNTAVSTATSADIKATQAIAAVASSALYTVVANVAAIPVAPANNTAIEVTDSTGIQSFTPLTGLPAGFIGSSGLSVRIIYSTTGPTWNWIQYFPNDPENRYLKLSGGTLTGALTLAADPVANLQPATKQYVDTADATLTSAAAAAQSTANAALPKAGGTMTGSITFAGGQSFPGVVTSVSGTAPISVTGTTTPTVSVSSGTTAAAGVVQLTDSTSSTSTTTAATPNSVKTAYDLANNALPKAGGTLTGDVVLDNQADLRFGENPANGSNYVGFQAPANIPNNVLWTLPATDAAVSGYALKSDGLGNLSWGLAGGASGGGANQIFYENDQTVTTNYTLTAGKNAMTAGPVTINNSVVVTIPSGQTWVIV